MTAPLGSVSRVAGTAASVGRSSLVLRERLTPDQVELLKKTVAKGANDDEFALFLHMCERTKLDPFAKQIYCLKRRTMDDEGKWVDAMVTQVGIDGFRLVAERTGDYCGQTAPQFFDAAGNAREVWLDSKKPPLACKVGVLKRGFTEPLYAIALYDEYVQRKRDGLPNRQWKEKPTIMLAKCAEAMALRKAFPNDLSGVYTDDELPVGEVDDTPTPTPVAATRARLTDGADLTARVNESGFIELTFGEHRGKALPDVPTSYLLVNFRDAWKDATKRATAVTRLGAGFVAAVEAEILRRQIPVSQPAIIAKLHEKRAAGVALSDEEAEHLRQWQLDQPAAEANASDAKATDA